jgi:hypothetical protein
MSGNPGQGNRPVEINLPEQASGNARASIPEHAVPEVAAMFREEYGEAPNGQPDDEYVADKLMDEIRERVRQYKYGKLIREAHQSVQIPDAEF